MRNFYVEYDRDEEPILRKYCDFTEAISRMNRAKNNKNVRATLCYRDLRNSDYTRIVLMLA